MWWYKDIVSTPVFLLGIGPRFEGRAAATTITTTEERRAVAVLICLWITIYNYLSVYLYRVTHWREVPNSWSHGSPCAPDALVMGNKWIEPVDKLGHWPTPSVSFWHLRKWLMRNKTNNWECVFGSLLYSMHESNLWHEREQRQEELWKDFQTHATPIDWTMQSSNNNIKHTWNHNHERQVESFK